MRIIRYILKSTLNFRNARSDVFDWYRQSLITYRTTRMPSKQECMHVICDSLCVAGEARIQKGTSASWEAGLSESLERLRSHRSKCVIGASREDMPETEIDLGAPGVLQLSQRGVDNCNKFEHSPLAQRWYSASRRNQILNHVFFSISLSAFLNDLLRISSRMS
jgi:hypothetical protein